MDYAKNCYPKEPMLTLKSKYTAPPIHKISVSKKFDKVALSRFITAWPEALIVFIVIKRINSEKVFEAYCPMCANSCFYGSAVLNYFLDWIENKGLKSSPNWVEPTWLAVLYSRLTFSAFYFKYLIKNPQTTIALIFLAHVISGLGGVPALNKYCFLHHCTDAALHQLHN